MNEENIKKLMYDLSQLKYKSDTSSYYFNVIESKELGRVEQVIRQHLLDNHDHELGEMKAKIYTYEKVIANSNFSVIVDKKDKWNELKKRLEKAIEELNPKKLEIGQFNIQNDDYTMGAYGAYKNTLTAMQELEGNNDI